jgi:hypothetical protein
LVRSVSSAIFTVSLTSPIRIKTAPKNSFQLLAISSKPRPAPALRPSSNISALPAPQLKANS